MSMYGMYVNTFFGDDERAHDRGGGATGGEGGVGVDAGGASSVGFPKETRGLSGGWWRGGGAELVSTCEARAPTGAETGGGGDEEVFQTAKTTTSLWTTANRWCQRLGRHRVLMELWTNDTSDIPGE